MSDAGHAGSPSPTKTPEDESRSRVLRRLRRAQGQLAAVIRAVEDGKPCREVVTQLAATSKALDRAGVALVSSAMQDCLWGRESGDSSLAADPEEFEKLFMMLA